MNPELLIELSHNIKAMDLTPYRDILMKSARVAIDLKLDGAATMEIGESRFGGAPDLPSGSDWPSAKNGEKLVFLVQINLGEIPPFEGNPFPNRGLLCVFLGLDEPASDVENRLFLFDDGDLARAAVPSAGEMANENYLDIAPQRLKMVLRADVPHWQSRDWEIISDLMDENEDDEAINALSDLGGRSSAHIGQLLGHVSGIGRDPRGDAYIVREVPDVNLYDFAKRSELDMTPAQNWLNLLRLDSDSQLGFCVWDAGYLNFLIRHDDLESLDFSRVYGAVETS